MHLNSHNIRPWARSCGATSEDLRCVVEMETVTCAGCGKRFTDRSDLDADRYCEECVENTMTVADMRREFGTW